MWGEMTRKRFVKLAMAAGVQRDTAALVAKDAIRRCEPYSLAIDRLLNFNTMINDMARKAALDLLRYGNAKVDVSEALRLCYPWIYERIAPIPPGNLRLDWGAAGGGGND